MRLFIILLLFPFFAFSQNKTRSFIQFDVSIPIKGNQNNGSQNNNQQSNNSWFLPDGINSKIGIGLEPKKWIALGIHSGIDWTWSEKIVLVPVFANLRLSPKISDETRIALQLGLGKGTALGRGALNGTYKKISLGIQNDDDLVLFIEMSHYDIAFKDQKETGSISLGVSLITF